MYHKKLESDIRCPLEYGLEVFGGKWKSRVICVLADKKTLRYSELRAELVNITDTSHVLQDWQIHNYVEPVAWHHYLL